MTRNRIFIISGSRELGLVLMHEIGLHPGRIDVISIYPDNHSNKLRGYRYNKETDIVIYGYYGDAIMTEVFDHLKTNGF